MASSLAFGLSRFYVSHGVNLIVWRLASVMIRSQRKWCGWKWSYDVDESEDSMLILEAISEWNSHSEFIWLKMYILQTYFVGTAKSTLLFAIFLFCHEVCSSIQQCQWTYAYIRTLSWCRTSSKIPFGQKLSMTVQSIVKMMFKTNHCSVIFLRFWENINELFYLREI